MPQFNHTLDCFINQVIDNSDKRLLELIFSKSLSQGELDSFLENWDIEKAPMQSIMALAYMSKTHPELSFPKSIEPRLKGVLSYLRFKNLKLVARFSEVASTLEKEGIPFMIIKGGAMKVYRPDYPRGMSDFDILVPEERFDESVSLIKDLGYSPLFSPHSVDMRVQGTKEGALDLHRFINMDTGKERTINDDMRKRASLAEAFGSKTYLPCPEDMVFISLVNLWKNVSNNTSPSSVLSSFFDIPYLIGSKEDFNWEIIRENAIKTGSSEAIYFASRFVSAIIPDLFPKDFLETDINESSASRILKRSMYNRKKLAPLRAQIDGLSLGEAIKEKKPLWNYLILRGKLFVLKRVGPS